LRAIIRLFNAKMDHLSGFLQTQRVQGIFKTDPVHEIRYLYDLGMKLQLPEKNELEKFGVIGFII